MQYCLASFYLVFLFGTAMAVWREKNEFSLASGLTDDEAQKLLDYHNYYRARQAKGGIPGQPPSADMTALEWDDSLAQAAQRWSQNCGGPMHDDSGNRGQGQCYVGYGGKNFMKYGFTSWCDNEWNGFDFERNNFLQGHGHYTQIVTAYTKKVGCGYARCDGHAYARLVCNFYPGGNLQDFHMFKRGRACSNCHYGRPYCMDGALCVRKDQCVGSKNKCECSIDWNRCKRNGGKADVANCHCECEPGWTGANCDVECKDMQYCGAFGKNCLKPHVFLTFYVNKCPKHCNLCTTIDLKRKENRRGLTINIYNSPDEVLKGGSKKDTNGGNGEDKNKGGKGGGNGGKDNGGNKNKGDKNPSNDKFCRDKLGSQQCETFKKSGFCETDKNGLSYHCRKTCNMCLNTSKDCQDDNEGCLSWKMRGDRICTDHNKSICKATCKLC